MIEVAAVQPGITQLDCAVTAVGDEMKRVHVFIGRQCFIDLIDTAAFTIEHNDLERGRLVAVGLEVIDE